MGLVHCFSLFLCKDGIDQQMKRASYPYSCCTVHSTFFPQTLILNSEFLVRFVANFRKDSWCHPLTLNLFFGVVTFRLRAKLRFLSVSMGTIPVQLFFHKLCLTLTQWFIVGFASNFHKRLLMPSSNPNLLSLWLFFLLNSDYCVPFSSPSAPAHEFSLSRRFGQDCPVLFQGTFE